MKKPRAEVVSAIGGIVPRPTKAQIIEAMVTLEMERREKEYREAKAACDRADKETKEAVLEFVMDSPRSFSMDHFNITKDGYLNVSLTTRNAPKKILSMEAERQSAGSESYNKFRESEATRAEIKRAILKRAQGIDPDDAVKRMLDIPAARRELAEMIDKVFGRNVKALPEVTE